MSPRVRRLMEPLIRKPLLASTANANIILVLPMSILPVMPKPDGTPDYQLMDSEMAMSPKAKPFSPKGSRHIPFMAAGEAEGRAVRWRGRRRWSSFRKKGGTKTHPKW